MGERAMCQRCKCCELVPEDCDACGGEGVCGHECGEDTCCCLDPEENMACDWCGGRGWFRICLGGCDEKGQHKRSRDGFPREAR